MWLLDSINNHSGAKRSYGVLVLLQSIALKFEWSKYMFSTSECATLGTLIYEDGKTSTGLAVDAGTCRYLVVLPKTKCLRASVFSTFSYRTTTSIT